MSKKRFIDTHFWSDTWVDVLSREERYLFLYLLTNDKTTIAGVYELPLKIISFESDFSKTEIITMFKKMESKIKYIDGWVVMRNGIKNQNYHNSKIKRGIEIILQTCPSKLLQHIDIPADFKITTPIVVDNPQSPLFVDEPWITLDEPSHSDTDSDTDLDSNSNSKDDSPNADFDKSKWQKPMTPKERCDYAIAMEREREQQKRVTENINRTGTGLSQAKATIEKIKLRKVTA